MRIKYAFKICSSYKFLSALIIKVIDKVPNTIKWGLKFT